MLSDRAKLAWMDFSVIYISKPNKPGEWSKSKTVDGKKMEFGLLFCGDGDIHLNNKIEVWRKSPVTKQENTFTMFKRLELDYLADLTIQCGDKSIEVHKVLLAQSSEFFRGNDNI